MPVRYELDEAEYKRIESMMAGQVHAAQKKLDEARAQDGAEDEDEEDSEEGSDDDEDEIKATAKSQKPATGAATDTDTDDELAEYNMDGYDDEPTVLQLGGFGLDIKFSSLADVGALNSFKNLKVHDEADDPYITLDDPALQSDEEDLMITPNDNLLVVGQTEDDISRLDVYVYEAAERNLYVHHDVMLPAFPLCIEWLDFPVRTPTDEGTRGNYVAVGTFDPLIEIWDLDTIDCAAPAVILGNTDPSMAQSVPVIVQSNKQQQRKPKKSSKPKANPHYHVDAVLGLSWNPTHRNVLASASADKTVKLWDLKTSTCVHSYSHHTDKVQAVKWNPSESTVFASGGYDKQVAVMDSRTPDTRVGGLLAADVESIRWDPHQTSCLYVATEDGMLYYLDVRQLATAGSAKATTTSAPPALGPAQAVYRVQAHDDPLSAFDVSPTIPGCFVTGSADHTVKLWSVTDNKPSMVLSRDFNVGQVFTAGFCPDAPFHIAVAGSQGKMTVWNAYSNAGVRNTFRARYADAAKEAPIDEKDTGVTVLQDNDDDDDSDREGAGDTGRPGMEAGSDDDEDEDMEEDM
ncbi:rRNA-processing protein [Tieghemiomyces parasiticus]|uniref:rRNA-processing protein n=1 Tax=Tieghemiomyces parasiticus TaxID=78921 RepID=A0A9W7ZN75_9FUNG|nr:rRNA-processing protein [Tieghemiomyces parasiticus]